jgi:peroxiredoxin Q/BCP
MLTAGDLAPDFTLATDAGEPLTLSSLRGRNVVLYFYPKDDTPGCNIEACEFRDALPRFDGLDAVVLGVSPDSVESHRKFRDKFDLPFTLLADERHEVAERYDVWKEKSMFGRTFMGVERTTLVIGPDGRIAHVFEKVRPEGHADEVARALTG